MLPFFVTVREVVCAVTDRREDVSLGFDRLLAPSFPGQVPEVPLENLYHLMPV